MNDFSNQALLVTGASGHLGRLVLNELLARGAKRVIAATRSPGKLEDFANRGVEIRRLDLDDATSTATAFAGVDRLLLISTDAVGRRIAQHKAAISAAEKAGVMHIVYTSAPSPKPGEDHAVSNDHFWTEAALFNSDLDWTILRNNIYTEILLLGAVPATKFGQWFDAAGAGGRAYVSREDAARAAAGALLSAEGKAIYEVSGPSAPTQAELAAIVANLAGKPISRVSLSREALENGLVAAGLGKEMAAVTAAFDGDAVVGKHAIVTDAVKELTGRSTTDIETFLTANKAAFA